MNIPSIFSVSKLLTTASFKEELSNIYNTASRGRDTMSKLWVLYWIIASLAQDKNRMSLCQKLMTQGYLNEAETEELNNVLVSLVKSTGDEDFDSLLEFSSCFFEPELLLEAIQNNFIDILVIDFASMLVESSSGVNKVFAGKTEIEIKFPNESAAIHYFSVFFKTMFYEQVEKPFKEICETEKLTAVDGDDLLKVLLDNFLDKVQEQIKSFKFHTVKKHHIEKIQQQKLFTSF